MMLYKTEIAIYREQKIHCTIYYISSLVTNLEVGSLSSGLRSTSSQAALTSVKLSSSPFFIFF